MNMYNGRLYFTDLILERYPFRVTWEWIGEGYSGDFDDKDPDDVPLLRFSCDKFDDIAQDYRQMDDASYCTRLSIDTPIRILAEAATIILEAIEDVSYKRRLEELSWFCIEDFRKE